MFVYNFSPYSKIFQLYDGVQFLLVGVRNQIQYAVWTDQRPSTSFLTPTLIKLASCDLEALWKHKELQGREINRLTRIDPHSAHLGRFVQCSSSNEV